MPLLALRNQNVLKNNIALIFLVQNEKQTLSKKSLSFRPDA